MAANTDTLTEINLDELVASFGWQDRPLLRRPLRRLFLGPAQVFASYMVDFDAAMEREKLALAGRSPRRSLGTSDPRAIHQAVLAEITGCSRRCPQTLSGLPKICELKANC